jgi:hypothetical protein
LHIARAGAYGYQRDELYFLSCAHHLAWGYVDQPPLIAVLARLVVGVFGDAPSLYALRFLPAVAAAATVVFTGLLARRFFGGGAWAAALAMAGVALAPFSLAVGNLLTMNAFEPLLWMGVAYFFMRAWETDRPQFWALVGLTGGLGLVNKYSMFFFAGCAFAALLLGPQRRVFRRPGFWGALALALAFAAPTLAWQASHDWPQLAVLRDAARYKNVVAGPFSFYLQQFLMMNPLSAPLWIAGLWVLIARDRAGMRWYGLTYAVLSLLYLTLGAKVYYLAPIYPVLFAAGAPALESAVRRVRWAAVAYPLALLASGAAIAPEAFPLLPLPQFLRYERVFDVRAIKMERHPEGKVPQQFADMLGWDTLVDALAGAYAAMPEPERREAVIFTRDYGQASAVDFFGPARGLPVAISGHNNYYLYGTRGASGKAVLAIGFERDFLRTEFGRVERVATYRDPYVLPDFNNLAIYACTVPRRPLAAWWPATKRFI